MISEPHLKYWGLNGIWAPKGSMISKPHQKIGGLNDIYKPRRFLSLWVVVVVVLY